VITVFQRTSYGSTYIEKKKNMNNPHGTDPYTGRDIVHPRVYRLRQLQLREGVNINNLSLEQRGLTAISNMHHVSKIVENSVDSYRVRICRTCSGMPNLLELGSYADVESALLVNDVHELHHGRMAQLHLLGMEDLRYSNMLQVRKRGAACDVSITDILAARLMKHGQNAANAPKGNKAGVRRESTKPVAAAAAAAAAAATGTATMGAAAGTSLSSSSSSSSSSSFDPLPLTSRGGATQHAQSSHAFDPAAASSGPLAAMATAASAAAGTGNGSILAALGSTRNTAGASSVDNMLRISTSQTSLANSMPHTERTSFDNLAAAASENATSHVPSLASRSTSLALSRVNRLVEQVRKKARAQRRLPICIPQRFLTTSIAHRRMPSYVS